MRSHAHAPAGARVSGCWEGGCQGGGLEVSVCVCVCVCVRSDRMPCHQSFLHQQGVPGAEQGWHQRRPLLLPVISISDARLTYLQRLCKVLLARCFLRCVCFMLNLVTFSPLEGNLVPCEPRLIILETFRLYSRLFSCTRNLASSIWSSSVYTPFVGNPRVYPLCDPGPTMSDSKTSTCLS